MRKSAALLLMVVMLMPVLAILCACCPMTASADLGEISFQATPCSHCCPTLDIHRDLSDLVSKEGILPFASALLIFRFGFSVTKSSAATENRGRSLTATGPPFAFPGNSLYLTLSTLRI